MGRQPNPSRAGNGWAPRRAGALLAGPVLGLSLLVGLVAWVGPEAILERLQGLRPGPTAAAALLLAAGGAVTGLRQHLFFPDLGRARFLRWTWSSWAFGMAMPGQVGEVASLTVFLTRAGVPTSRAVGLLLADRLLAAVVMGTLGALGLARVMPAPLLAAGVGLAVLGGALLVALRKRLPFLEPLRETLARPGLVPVHLATTLGRQALWVTAWWLTFPQLGASVPWSDVLLLTCAAGLAGQLPVGTGLGTVEAAAVLLYAPLGVPAGTVVAAYGVVRLLALLVAWVPIPVLLRVGGPGAGASGIAPGLDHVGKLETPLLDQALQGQDLGTGGPAKVRDELG